MFRRFCLSRGMGLSIFCRKVRSIAPGTSCQALPFSARLSAMTSPNPVSRRGTFWQHDWNREITGKPHTGLNSKVVGGFNPIEKYESKWESSPSRGETKTYLKPPPIKFIHEIKEHKKHKGSFVFHTSCCELWLVCNLVYRLDVMDVPQTKWFTYIRQFWGCPVAIHSISVYRKLCETNLWVPLPLGKYRKVMSCCKFTPM